MINFHLNFIKWKKEEIKLYQVKILYSKAICKIHFWNLANYMY